MNKQLIVCDIGASSARVFSAGFDGGTLSLDVLHRFSNKPIIVGASLYWDIFALHEGLKRGIAAAGNKADSIGIDSFSNDYLLFDASGTMIEPPHTYRDGRTLGMLEEMDKRISRKELYYRTGLQFNRMNSLYQWLSVSMQRPQLWNTAESLLFVPDALTYFLTGERVTEYTLASVSQGFHPTQGGWDLPLLDAVGLPARLLQRIVQPGETVGVLSAAVCAELSTKPLPVVAVGEHDTASAVAAVPSLAKRFAFISSGTWSIVGTEIDKPLIDERSYRFSLANEGGVGGRIRLLKNVMGLWILQECRRYWHERGCECSFESLEQMAAASNWEKGLFDPDDEIFYLPGPMPELIARYFSARGETAPAEKGDIVRCVLLSLACKYRYVLECLEYACGYELPIIHVIGGGAQNQLLNQLTANLSGKPVFAGPVEATALGNAMVQLIASGEFGSLDEARGALIRSCEIAEYAPDHQTKWQEIYESFLRQTRLTPVL
jgi:rhamnulokinase